MAIEHHLQVFISSPGDVGDERSIALKLVNDLPYDPLLGGRVTFRAISWDTIGGPPMEANLSPQQAIRQGLPLPSQCDIFVGVFWTRIGTPLDIDGTTFFSGSHYEYEDAMKGNRETGRPRVLLYRRTSLPGITLSDPALEEKRIQYQNLERFFESFVDVESGHIKGGYNKYETPDDFRRSLDKDLRFVLRDLMQTDRQWTRSRIGSPVTPATNNVVTSSARFEWQGSPFPGLRAFGIEDEPIFFGRGREIDLLTDRVRSNYLSAVVGASGSGKSSLIAAGVVPRLLATSERDCISIVFSTPDSLGTGDPFSSLAFAFSKALPDLYQSDVECEIQKYSERLLEILEEYKKRHSKNVEVILVIDQFEELFTTVRKEYLERFAEMIKCCIDEAACRVIIAIRGDFFGECLRLRSIAELLESSVFPLRAPRTADLHEMLRRPADRANLTFEDGLIQTILNDTGSEPGSLALMAYTLDELYHGCGEQRLLSYEMYTQLGGVQGAIGKRSEDVFCNLNEEAQAALPVVFRHLVEVDERGTATRRRERLDKVAASRPAADFVEKMTTARLLVQGRGDKNVAVVEVAHEALLRSWTRLATWIEDTKNDLRLIRQVSLAAQEWNNQGRTEEYLWPHERLAEVYSAKANLMADFDEVTRLFIEPEIERLKRELFGRSVKPHRRITIVERIANIGGGAAENVLIEALDSSKFPETFLVHVVRALARLGSRDAITKILALNFGGQKNLISVISAIGTIGDPRAVKFLETTIIKNSGNETIETSVKTALRRIGGPKAESILMRLEKPKRRFFK